MADQEKTAAEKLAEETLVEPSAEKVFNQPTALLRSTWSILSLKLSKIVLSYRLKKKNKLLEKLY